MSDEVPLLGGNVSGGVVRVGDTVRRPAGPWTVSVHALLVHLEAVGFDGAPRSLGLDDQGRHVVAWVEGEVHEEFRPPKRSAGLRRVGRLLRDLHDACAEFVQPADAGWQVVIPPDRTDLVVHHDAAPWNLVLGARRWVLIDWDGAGPGSRLGDLAYAAHGFVPLAPRSGPSSAGRGLAELAAGYRLDQAQRRDPAGLLVPRIRGMHDLLARGHRDGVQPWARLWQEGHGEVWRRDAEWTEEHAALLLAALLAAD